MSRLFSRLSPIWWARIGISFFFIALMVVLLPGLNEFSSSITVLKNAQPVPIALATVAVICTYVVAACIYLVLALKPLRFKPTFSIQVATAFTNRLLPAGLGGISLYAVYLRKNYHTLPQALAVTATNNLVGVVGHLVLLGIVAVSGGQVIFSELQAPRVEGVVLLGVTLLCMVLGIWLARQHKIRRHIKSFLFSIGRQLDLYRHTPLRLMSALGLAMCLTLGHVVALYFCSQAVGLHVSLWISFIVFTAGILAGTATPTPGGLGGIEAGLLAGFVAYGSLPAQALAAVLLYRLLTYWLLLVPGFITFIAIRKKLLYTKFRL